MRAYHDPESKTPEARRARIDPIYFGERYIKPHDARWTIETKQFQKDMVQHLLKGSRFDPTNLAIYPNPSSPEAKADSVTSFRTAWIPIEHAKTTWLSITLPLWALAVDQEAMICLMGNRVKDAQKSLGPIKWHIEHNQLLRADFPELRPDESAGWSDERIFVERKSRSKDPSIQTAGITTTIQGSRLDFVLGDDVQDRTRALSDLKNQADQENWQEIVENRVVDGGVCASYGTLQTSRDLNATLSRSEGYEHMHLAARDLDGTYGPVGAPLFLTEQRIATAQKRQGARRFARKYMNDAKDEGGKLLGAELLHYVHHDDVPWKNLIYFAGVDPATGESEQAEPDEYSIAVVGVDRKTSTAYLVATYGSAQWNIAEGTKQLQKLHEKYNFHRVAVEAVAFSVAAKQNIWSETAIPAYKSPTTKSKHIRFDTMSHLFEVERVLVVEEGPGIFPDADDDLIENFYDQWIDFDEGRHDDRLDAVEKACEAAMISATVPQTKTDRVREALSKASFG
jgi:phage terminase large subunit-like protein